MCTFLAVFHDLFQTTNFRKFSAEFFRKSNVIFPEISGKIPEEISGNFRTYNPSFRHPPSSMHSTWFANCMRFSANFIIDGDESVIKLTPCDLLAIQRFNRFVVCIYMQSWFTSKTARDAPFNDIMLIERLTAFDDEGLNAVGLKAMKRHSWYLSPELASLVLFSDKISCEDKLHWCKMPYKIVVCTY